MVVGSTLMLFVEERLPRPRLVGVGGTEGGINVGVVGVGRLVTELCAECVSMREPALLGIGVGTFSEIVSIFDLGLSIGDGLGMRVVPVAGLLVNVMVVAPRRDGLELFGALYFTWRLRVSL